MSVLPSIHDTSGSLFLHISSIPKINKTQFISSFLQEQMIHAKTYAAEGRALERSWKQEEVQVPISNLNGTPGPQKTSKLVMDIGFGTPVLKPREARRLDGNQEIAQTKDSIFSNVENVTREAEVLEKRVLKKRKQRRSPGPRKGSSINGSENEYEQRLKERRERKRVKRAVMKSASNPDSLHGSSTEGTKGKNKKTKKTAKNIGLAGLALMHGFTATNVGKGRLTVKPSLNAGVFNKGKASVKSRPVQRDKRLGKRPGHTNGGFIEDDFLSKTPKDLRKRRAASGSSSETSSSRGSRTKAKITRRLQKKSRSASKSMTLESSPSIAEKAGESIKPNNRKPSESIIWDIERESVILPSNPSTSVSEEAISVLVDTKNTSWSKAPVDIAAPLLNHQRSPALHQMIQSDDTEHIHKSPSIGPSESASQYVKTSSTRRDPAIEAASKYFPSVPQPQPSEERSPSEGVTSELETRKAVTIEALAGEFMHTNKKYEDLSSALSSDVISAQVQDDKRHAAICGSHLVDLDDLPFVEPQDYKYSDHSFQIGPSEDLDCYEVLPAMIPSYSVLDELNDERIQDENFFIHQWDVLELAYQPQELEETGYEEQYHNQEEDLDDDEYGASEYEDKYIIPSRAASQVRNSNLIHNADWNMEELGYHTGNLLQGRGEANIADNSSISVHLDTCVDYDLGLGQSIDLISTFTEGKALLRGYSEAGARMFHSPSCQQIQVIGAEADVAKRLKNHWLPQRL